MTLKFVTISHLPLQAWLLFRNQRTKLIILEYLLSVKVFARRSASLRHSLIFIILMRKPGLWENKQVGKVLKSQSAGPGVCPRVMRVFQKGRCYQRRHQPGHPLHWKKITCPSFLNNATEAQPEVIGQVKSIGTPSMSFLMELQMSPGWWSCVSHNLKEIPIPVCLLWNFPSVPLLSITNTNPSPTLLGGGHKLPFLGGTLAIPY